MHWYRVRLAPPSLLLLPVHIRFHFQSFFGTNSQPNFNQVSHFNSFPEIKLLNLKFSFPCYYTPPPWTIQRSHKLKKAYEEEEGTSACPTSFPTRISCSFQQTTLRRGKHYIHIIACKNTHIHTQNQ